jgi:hypothetical protein
LAFLTQNKAKLSKILIITLVFEKIANVFAKNCQNSQKIVIITSTPGSYDRQSEIKKCHLELEEVDPLPIGAVQGQDVPRL